jgi:hypothetical protein
VPVLQVSHTQSKYKMLKALNPAVMKANYNAAMQNFTKWGSREIRKGSIVPFFSGMALVGVVGYTMEYTQVGKYHVAEKQAIVKKAMAAHHH